MNYLKDLISIELHYIFKCLWLMLIHLILRNSYWFGLSYFGAIVTDLRSD